MSDKPRYRVTGNDRADPNTGHGEAFEIVVEARHKDAAEIIARRQRTKEGRHHILIGAITSAD